MTTELGEEVRKCAADVLEVPAERVTLETGVGDLPEWDSLGHTALLTRIEGVFDVVFDMDDMLSIETIEDLIDVIARRRNASQ